MMAFLILSILLLKWTIFLNGGYAQDAVSHEDHSQDQMGDADEDMGEDSSEKCSASSHGALLPYLQVDDIDSGLYDNYENLPENSCYRPCVRGESRTCYYRFTFESYSVMGKDCKDCITNKTECYNRGCVTADGFEKGILTINRQLPGPSIQVCEGDYVVVDVKNSMPGRSTTIHWHGVRQKNNNWMDGVPMVTQCPINEGQIFRYTFLAEDPVMHFYHSHDGLQKVDGIVGSLVIRMPKDEDPNKKEYDRDCPSHVIVVQDWYHLMADAMFPGLRYRDNEQFAASYLIQGRGDYILSDGSKLIDSPIAVFNVTQGLLYVFRIVAGTCFECQYMLTIEKHDMLIIGVDAKSTKPYRVDSLTMSPGERCSVVVNCNRSVAAYWIQVRTVGLCNHMRANQVAILRYSGASEMPDSPRPSYDITDVNRPGITLSPVNSNCTEKTRIEDGPCISHLRSANKAPEHITKRHPDMRIIWAFGFFYYTPANAQCEFIDYHRFLQSPFGPVGSTINGIVNMFPPSPILSQYNDIPQHLLCPPGGYEAHTWNLVHRECVHVVKVPAYSTIEIVCTDIAAYDPDGISHAIHLHGYDLHILEMGVLNQSTHYDQSYKELMGYLVSDRRKEIPIDVVTKDTFALTSGGYMVARIYTDNPGYWFFHCHFAYHLDSGMSGILQVGEHSTFSQPPEGFPKCGDYLPVP